ncbi:hypothetical protein BCR43DRAFT_487803 [Syncephalastrum racemosum]|uniref:Uncharacterized protein n=1 Tax=Syncephalastrum racemosum TaxID=13706 RepID=A0A1X2HHL1_SYNRA|nr:hypothetical protein BCR43DRAFT_487803 [Syncephalastrum racemosum]
MMNSSKSSFDNAVVGKLSFSTDGSASPPSTPSENAVGQHQHSANNTYFEKAASQEISLQTMSSVIAAAVQMSSNRGNPPSSLSLGHASIVPKSDKNEQGDQQKKVSSAFFSKPLSWRSSGSAAPSAQQCSSPSTTAAVTRPRRSSSSVSARFAWLANKASSKDEIIMEKKSIDESIAEVRTEEDMPDDGRAELMYRGIRVKEVKTTLKTMIIPHEVENPMPQIKLERPSFARINY